MRKYFVMIALIVGMALGVGGYTLAQDVDSTPASVGPCETPVSSPVATPNGDTVATPDITPEVELATPPMYGAESSPELVPGEMCATPEQ